MRDTIFIDTECKYPLFIGYIYVLALPQAKSVSIKAASLIATASYLKMSCSDRGISASQLKNLRIGPELPCFNIGMDKLMD